MSDAQKQEQDELQKYLEAKAKQDQKGRRKIVSGYDAYALIAAFQIHVIKQVVLKYPLFLS